MNTLNLFFLTLMHCVMGFSLLNLLRVKIDNSLLKICISLLLGIGITSLLPMFMEFAHIKFTKTSVIVTIIGASLFPFLLTFKQTISEIKSFSIDFSKIKIYDLLALGAMFYLLYIGSYKCYLFPTYSRDFTSGPEVIAEYAIKEGHIINSVFGLDLLSTNNHQKPPFIVGLQIIYKMFVQEFGQVWLILISHAFFISLYLILRKFSHALFAGIFVLASIAVPELYAYIIMVLFDFSNMVYVFIGFYFLYQYLFYEERQKSNLILSSIFFMLATYIRPETMILSSMVAGFYFIWSYREDKLNHWKTKLFHTIYIALPSILMYIISIEIFVKRLLPGKFHAINAINSNLSHLSPLWQRYSDMIHVLMYNRNPNEGYSSIGLFNETFTFLLIFVLAELGIALYRKTWERKSQFWFFSILITYLFIGFFGYLLPLATLNDTTKRALFKLIPLIFAFGSQTFFIQFLSRLLHNWELDIKSKTTNLEIESRTNETNKKKKK